LLQVVDIFESEYEQELNTHGLQLLLDRQLPSSYLHEKYDIKIIIIHTNLSVEISNAYQTRKEVQKSREEYSDAFYVPALQHFLLKPQDYNYANVFNVRLSKFPLTHPENKIFILNEHASYAIPEHFNSLCQAIERYNLYI
jgi:hypothetical protein